MKVKGKADLHVRVLSPTQTHYDGPATAVSAENAVGPFDILADHANFFSLLTPSLVSITTETQRYELKIQQGIIKVKNNAVTLFIDIEGSSRPQPEV
jgi:F-type H+-transporting ATPase subunit epsilon